MLFVEYDVTPDGQIDVVALINAVEAEGRDADGDAWLDWRRRVFDDQGMGCARVAEEDLTLLESTEDADEVRSIVERIILADRRAKERIPP